MSTGTLTRSGRNRPGTPSPMIDPRLQERRREVTRDRGRRRLRRLSFAGAVVLLAGAAYGATRSPLLDVDHVRLSGAAGERAEAVVSAAAIDIGSPMTGVEPGAVERRVAELPWVRHVQVERRWPGTVAVAVTERQAVAVDSSGSALDATGRSFGPVAAGDHLPEVSGADVRPGESLPEELEPVLSVLVEAPPALAGQITSGALVEGDVELVLDDGIRVRFGPDERHRAKFTALEALLEQADRETMRSIDLRVPTSPSLTRRPGTGA